MYVIFFVKQKTAYEMLISDWSSDVCSSDLPSAREIPAHPLFEERLPRSVGKPVGPFNLSGAGVDQSRFDSGLCISAEKRIVEAAIGARARSAGHLINFIRNGDVAGVLSRRARRLNSDR